MSIETTQLELGLKQKIDGLRRRYGHETASHSFAQLYLWRRELGLTAYLQEELFAVRSTRYGENAWLFPVGDAEAKTVLLGQLLTLPELRLSALREQDCAFLEERFPGAFTIEPTPDESEYLYDRAEQIELSGKRFAGIRNHLRRVAGEHALRTETLSEQNREAALEITEDWERRRHERGEFGIRDDGIPTEMLSLTSELETTGVLIYVDEEPYAVCAGYPLSDTVYDLAMAKQKDNLPGLSYHAKREFYLSLPEQYRIINAEEDLGIEGLRTMKHQMRPSGMVELFRAQKK